MSIRKIYVLVILTIVFCSPSFGGGPPNGFRGMSWGSQPPSTGVKKVFGPSSDGATIYAPNKFSAFNNIPIAEEAYSYDFGKLYSVSIWIDGPENLENVKNELTKAHGTPTFANERLNIWKWKWQGSKIEVHLSYQPKFGRTSVTYLNGG